MLGAVLAGGLSSRFGSDKALALFRGQTLLALAARSLRQVCGRVVVSGSPERYGKMGYDVVADAYVGWGPLGGIEAVLGQCSDASAMFLPCDMPLVDAAMLRRLASGHQSGRRGAVFVVAGRAMPFPCVLPRRAAADACEMLERGAPHSMRDLLEKLEMDLLEVPRRLEWKFANVNRPSQLDELDPRE